MQEPCGARSLRRLAVEQGLFRLGRRAIDDELRGGLLGFQADPCLALEALGVFEPDLEATLGLRGVGARGNRRGRAVVAHLDDLAQRFGGLADGHAVGRGVEESTVEHAVAGAATATVDEGNLRGAAPADPLLARHRAIAVAIVTARGATQELPVDAPTEQAQQDDGEHVSPHG
jgi:hypothetical protein